jgi:hypothetical protein
MISPEQLFFIRTLSAISPPTTHDMLEHLLEVIEFLADVFFPNFCWTVQFGFS